MPKSKRSRAVALTQTEKRSTRDHKAKFIEEDFRGDDGSSSRIFLGKNKLLQIALGRTPEEEYADNLHQIGKRIHGGSVGLLLTSKDKTSVEQYFANLHEPDFARAGSTADDEVLISNANLESFPVSMMEQFRKCGMPVEIKVGKIVLRDGKDWYRICKKGEALSAEKCKLLVLFGMRLSTFKVQLVGRWSGGEFELLN
ncbi:hypothetical protein ACA910_004194 [Epithemia clementina (nom. ined.)]